MSAKNGKHTMQDPHTESECRINEPEHSHPDTDCGHYVASGPDLEREKRGDLNMYDEDHGKRAIVAGGPKHDLDQDANNGPGVK